VSRLSDCLHDAPWYARKATLPVRNGLYRATQPVRDARWRFRNWANRRAVAKGRRLLPERMAARVAPKVPVYRSRINPGTGRPRRDDAWMGRLQDESLRRLRDAHAQRFFPPHEHARTRGR